jgi:hypothetical protein
MAEKEMEFSKNGGKLKITLDIGENKTGVSSFSLFKGNTSLQRERTTSTFKTFEITPAPTGLDNALLMLDVTIIGDNTSGQKWAFTVTIKQDNKSIGVFEYPDSSGEDPKTFKKMLVMKTKEVRLKGK